PNFLPPLAGLLAGYPLYPTTCVAGYRLTPLRGLFTWPNGAFGGQPIRTNELIRSDNFSRSPRLSVLAHRQMGVNTPLSTRTKKVRFDPIQGDGVAQGGTVPSWSRGFEPAERRVESLESLRPNFESRINP